MSRKNVSAAEVRAWAVENLSSIPEEGHKSVLGAAGDGSKVRGRLHPEVIKAFHKANKGKVYETASDAEKPTVTVRITGKDKNGRNRPVTETLLTSEARALLGETGKKGRFNMTALTAAVQARYDAERAAAQAA